MLMKLETNKLNDHNVGMTCSDFHDELNIYVTGGLDQYVRVFNLKKELLKEVLFPQPVESICFMNRHGDMVVGHDTKVSLIKFEEMMLHKITDGAYPLKRKEAKNFYKNTHRLNDLSFWEQKQVEQAFRVCKLYDTTEKPPKR
jgi:hypothetical protein